MPEGFLFDLFGTLLVYGDMTAAWEDWLTALHRSLAGQGIRVSRAAFAAACEGIMSWPEPPGAGAGLTIYERRLFQLGGKLDTQLDAVALRHAAEASISAWQTHVALDPDAIPVLRALCQRGRLLGLVSNYDHPPHVHQLLRELELGDYFDPIVVSGDVGLKKPDPGILRYAMERMGLTSDQVAYVGDSEEDIQASLGAGVTPILIRRATSGDQRPVTDYGRTGSMGHSAGETASAIRVISTLAELVDLAS